MSTDISGRRPALPAMPVLSMSACALLLACGGALAALPDAAASASPATAASASPARPTVRPDPGDPATAEADARKQDYTQALDANALQGKRIGVARFLAGYHGPTDAAFEQALAELKEAGAELVEITEFPARGQVSAAETTEIAS